MKLFCKCNICHKKMTLDVVTQSRQQLANVRGVSFNAACPYCNNQSHYHVNSIRAESSYQKAAGAGAVIGGVLGILAGPIGIFIGAAAGGLGGGGIRLTDKNEVDFFNRYYL